MAREYKDQILDTSVNTKRVYNIVDSDGNIVAENVSLEDKTVYSQEGTEFGAQEVNEIYEAIDEVNSSLTLDYSQSRLPETTDIKSFLQMVLEKLYPLVKYLFKETGGALVNLTTWSTNSYAYTTINETNIKMYRYSNAYCSLITDDKLDVTNYSKIVIDLQIVGSEAAANGSVKFGLCVEKAPSSSTDFAKVNTLDYQGTSFTRQTRELDISDLEGEYYIKLYHGANSSGSNENIGTATIYNIYLE